MLKNSARNSRLTFSVIGFRLSQRHPTAGCPVRSIYCGRHSQTRRPIGQSLRQCVGREAIDVEPLRHGLGPAPLQMRSGLGQMRRVGEILVRQDGKGEAALKVMMPESSIPARALTSPPLFKKGCPFPNGNCQMGLRTSRCLCSSPTGYSLPSDYCRSGPRKQI